MFIDGWAYTNDNWLGPRPVSYTSGEEVLQEWGEWFDEERYKGDG